MKIKQESISSVLGQIRKEDKKKAQLTQAPAPLTVNMTFKNREEKVMWLIDELKKEMSVVCGSETTSRGHHSDTQPSTGVRDL